MTKKDYKLIAGAINSVTPIKKEDAENLTDRDKAKYAVLKQLTKRLGQKLKADNPRFDYDKFYKACME